MKLLHEYATYNVHVREFGIEITVREIGLRGSKGVRIRVARPNARRYGVGWEVPDLDARRSPECGKYTAASCVESSAVGCCTVTANTAAVETATSATVGFANMSASLTPILVVHWHTTR